MANEITQNSILRITDDKTLQLVELYEEESCLWNSKLEDYKIREKRIAAAERIAKTLNIKNFEAKHVMIKFKNLRNSYCQELKKIANSINSQNVEVYKPKVFWFNKMDSFLRPHLQPSRTTGFLRQFEDAESREEWAPRLDVEIKREASEEPEDWQIVSRADAEACASPSDDDAPAQRAPELRRRRSSSRRPIKRLRIEEIHSCAPPMPPLQPNPSLSLLKNISTNLETLVQQRDDPLESFGKYVATMLRSLPAQKALDLQPKIVRLITGAAIGNSDGRVSQSDENV